MKIEKKALYILFLLETTRLKRPNYFFLLFRFNNYLICSVEMLIDCIIVVNGNSLKHFKTKLDNSVAIECKYGTRFQCVWIEFNWKLNLNKSKTHHGPINVMRSDEKKENWIEGEKERLRIEKESINGTGCTIFVSHEGLLACVVYRIGTDGCVWMEIIDDRWILCYSLFTSIYYHHRCQCIFVEKSRA